MLRTAKTDIASLGLTCIGGVPEPSMFPLQVIVPPLRRRVIPRRSRYCRFCNIWVTLRSLSTYICRFTSWTLGPSTWCTLGDASCRHSHFHQSHISRTHAQRMLRRQNAPQAPEQRVVSSLLPQLWGFISEHVVATCCTIQNKRLDSCFTGVSPLAQEYFP